jgi:hypothetical protein
VNEREEQTQGKHKVSRDVRTIPYLGMAFVIFLKNTFPAVANEINNTLTRIDFSNPNDLRDVSAEKQSVNIDSTI